MIQLPLFPPVPPVMPSAPIVLRRDYWAGCRLWIVWRSLIAARRQGLRPMRYSGWQDLNSADAYAGRTPSGRYAGCYARVARYGDATDPWAETADWGAP